MSDQVQNEPGIVESVGSWFKGMLCNKFEVACDKPSEPKGPKEAYELSQKVPEGLGVNEAADVLHNRQAQLNKQMSDLGI